MQVVLDYQRQAEHRGALSGPQPSVRFLGQVEAQFLIHGQDGVKAVIHGPDVMEGIPDKSLRGEVASIQAFAPIRRGDCLHA
jgi:hypothetical protein